MKGDRYINSFFKLVIYAPNANLRLNPLVNAAGRRARLVQALSKDQSWGETYAFAVLAVSRADYPNLKSLTRYVRSVRHSLERVDGLPLVRKEFPVRIAGIQFVGAIVEEHVPSGRKYYRGFYSTFRDGYILSFDAEAASVEKLTKLLQRTVTFSK